MPPHRITKKRNHGTGRRRGVPNDIWAKLDVSVTNQSKIQIIESVIRSIYAQNLLYSDYRLKSARCALHRAIEFHVKSIAPEFQSHFEKNPEETVAFFRKLIVQNKAYFKPPKAGYVYTEGPPETSLITETRVTTPVPVVQEEFVGTEAPPNTPEERNIWDSDLDDFGVEVKLELSAEELRTVKGSPRRPRSHGFHRVKVLSIRQIPTTEQLYQTSYFSPVFKPAYKPSMALNRTFSLFQYNIDKVQTECRVVLVNSRHGMDDEQSSLEWVSGAKPRQEFPILSSLTVGESRIAKAYRRPYETIIYAICPDFGDWMFCPAWSQLWLCYYKIFELAERNGIGSISLPPLAADMLFPQRGAAKLMLGAIREYLETRHLYEATLRRVIICGSNEDEIKPYRSITP